MAKPSPYIGGCVVPPNLLGMSNAATAFAVLIRILKYFCSMTVYDDISASSKVLMWQLDSNVPPVYLKLDLSSTIVTWAMYAYWNNSTHVGIMGYRNGSYSTFDIFYMYQSWSWLIAYKNYFHINIPSSIGPFYQSSYTYSFSLINMFPAFIPFAATRTSASISPGTTVTITVASTANFVVGNQYMLFGAAYGEGKENVAVTQIIDATHLVVASVSGSYASNAYLCVHPLVAVQAGGGSIYVSFRDAWDAKAADSTSISLSFSGVSSGLISPTAETSRVPITQVYAYYGTRYYLFDENIFLYSSASLADRGAFGFNADGSQIIAYTATGGTLTTITVTGAGWGVNALVGEYVFVTAGGGDYSCRLIVSNTSDTITVSLSLAAIPNVSTVFYIGTNFHRYCNQISSTLYFLEDQTYDLTTLPA